MGTPWKREIRYFLWLQKENQTPFFSFTTANVVQELLASDRDRLTDRQTDKRTIRLH